MFLRVTLNIGTIVFDEYIGTICSPKNITRDNLVFAKNKLSQ